MIDLGINAVVLLVGLVLGIGFLIALFIEARRTDAVEKARARRRDVWLNMPRHYRR